MRKYKLVSDEAQEQQRQLYFEVNGEVVDVEVVGVEVVDVEEIAEWRALGKLYGIPSCCIEAFVERHLRGEDASHRLVNEVDAADVWVPCAQHREHPPAGYRLEVIQA